MPDGNAFVAHDAFILKFDMRDPIERAECGRLMAGMGTNTVDGCEAIIVLHQVNIIQKRAEVRRALRRKPSPNAHMIGQDVPRHLSLDKYAAEIEQRAYEGRWEEARRLCWSIRCTRRGLAELIVKRDRLRMEMIIARDHRRPTGDFT
jgi:hypothetical protein